MTAAQFLVERNELLARESREEREARFERNELAIREDGAARYAAQQAELAKRTPQQIQSDKGAEIAAFACFFR